MLVTTVATCLRLVPDRHGVPPDASRSTRPREASPVPRQAKCLRIEGGAAGGPARDERGHDRAPRRRPRPAVPRAQVRPFRLLARRGPHQRCGNLDYRQLDRQPRRCRSSSRPPCSPWPLGATFALWYRSERTLSIQPTDAPRREAFYWLAILFTFALGTAAGDLLAERLAVGYLLAAVIFAAGIFAAVIFPAVIFAAVIFAAAIAAVAVGRFGFGVNAVLAFWAAYVLTRPLGASIGDYLSQSRDDGGLGLGTTATSGLFLLTILAIVVYQ